MKKRSLLSLIIPLCALSGCSYRGDYKPLRDGDILLREAFEIRDDSFANVDRHIKANDTFCIYFSKEGCSACEDFLHGFKEVVQENKILTFHLETPHKKDDMIALFQAYPDFDVNYSPSFFVVDAGKIECIPYDQINSESRLRNALKRKVSLVDQYYFEAETVNFKAALEKTELSEVTLLELDFSNDISVNLYKTYKANHDEPLFIHQEDGLTGMHISKVIK